MTLPVFIFSDSSISGVAGCPFDHLDDSLGEILFGGLGLLSGHLGGCLHGCSAGVRVALLDHAALATVVGVLIEVDRTASFNTGNYKIASTRFQQSPIH